MTRLRLLKVHSNVYLGRDFFYDSQHIEGYIMPFKDYHDYEVERDCDSVRKIASKMQLGLDFEIPSHQLRYLYWDGYPLDSLPSNFDGENLVELHLKCSNIKRLWQENEVLLSFNNDFFCFILILKLLIVISFIETIFFRCGILKV